MSILLTITFALYPILISGISLIWQLSSRNRSRQIWALRVLACGSMVVFGFLACPWAFTSYYLRYALLGLFPVTVVISFPRGKRGTLQNRRGGAIPSVFVFLFFSVLNFSAITSQYSSAATVNVAFPFRTGVYYVLQGGTSAVTNTFHTLSGSKFAIDIVKLNPFGNRAEGIAPMELGSYSTFGEELCSPCQGVILEVCDSLPDNSPGKPDIVTTKGNYILLNCPEVTILMCHLKQGSIRVTPGETVVSGQSLAEIGNSGNIEPHLHIDGSREGMGIRLTFDGRALSTNSVIIRK